MDTATQALKFENKAIIPSDPRTKLFLTITVSTIMITGGTGGFMNVVRPCLMACPLIFLLLSKKWKAAARFAAIYAVLFILELSVLPLLAGAWNLYAHASWICHGILSGEHDNGQRICQRDGTDARSTEDRHPDDGGVSLFSYTQRGVCSHTGCDEDARHHDAPQPHEDAGIPGGPADDFYQQNWRRTLGGSSHARAWRTAKTDEYL